MVEAPEGGIMGVYSLSREEPIKTGNFNQEDTAFSKAKNYREKARADSSLEKTRKDPAFEELLGRFEAAK